MCKSQTRIGAGDRPIRVYILGFDGLGDQSEYIYSGFIAWNTNLSIYTRVWGGGKVNLSIFNDFFL